MSRWWSGLTLLSVLCGACVEAGVVGHQAGLDAGTPSMQSEGAPVDGGAPELTDATVSDVDGTQCVGQPDCVPCQDAATCPQALPYCQDARCVACREDQDCSTDKCEDGRCVQAEADEEEEDESEEE